MRHTPALTSFAKWIDPDIAAKFAFTIRFYWYAIFLGFGHVPTDDVVCFMTLYKKLFHFHDDQMEFSSSYALYLSEAIVLKSDFLWKRLWEYIVQEMV